MGTKKAKKWKVIRIDEDTYKHLKKLAKNRGESLSHLIWSFISQDITRNH